MVVAPLDRLGGWPGRTAGAVLADGRVVATAGPVGEVFAWASVTKLATALAVLVAVEEGTVALDDAAGPPGSTVRHLLAHASGLPPEAGPPLAAPGERRIYSNAGFEVMADHLADRAGMGFDAYLAAAVLEPLGMADTVLSGSPASGIVGPVRDLAILAAELQRPTLVAAPTLAEATAVAYPGLAGVLPGLGHQDANDWGLGMELRGKKSPHWTGSHNSSRTFGHFGRAGGFLWVDPDAGPALAVLGDHDFGPWAAEAWPALSDDVLAAYAS